MAVLEWQESLVVGDSVMDETHREFVDLLNALSDADESAALSRLDAFLQHTALGVAQWFENHAASMDAVLALYMKEHGYAPTPGG
jgi:hemerythrin